jgi:hypothetical protein
LKLFGWQRQGGSKANLSNHSPGIHFLEDSGMDNLHSRRCGMSWGNLLVDEEVESLLEQGALCGKGVGMRLDQGMAFEHVIIGARPDEVRMPAKRKTP